MGSRQVGGATCSAQSDEELEEFLAIG